MSGERQQVTHWDQARADHRARYAWAEKQINQIKGSDTPLVVLDSFCGVGYGTWYLAVMNPHWYVGGVDGDGEAIETAHAHFSRYNNEFHRRTWRPDIVEPLPESSAGLDVIVSLESVEHVDPPELFVRDMCGVLKVGGLFIFSTPNEDLLPRLPGTFPHHVRHVSLFEALLLAQTGWHATPPRQPSPILMELVCWAGQDVYELGEDHRVLRPLPDATQETIQVDAPGQFTLVVARRVQ